MSTRRLEIRRFHYDGGQRVECSRERVALALLRDAPHLEVLCGFRPINGVRSEVP